MSQEITAIGAQVTEIASELGEHELASSLKEELSRRIGGGVFRAMVLGEINHGKSSLINALFRQDLLPVGVTPTTSALVTVRAGEQHSAHLLTHEDQNQVLDKSSFRALVKGKPGAEHGDLDPKKGYRLDLRCPSEDFDSGLEFIDTPGFNDIAKLRAQLTQNAIPKADLVLLVLDATQAVSNSELELISQVLESMGGIDAQQLLVAVNRADLVPEDAHAEIKHRVRSELAKLKLEGVAIHLTCSKSQEDPGVSALRAQIATLSGKQASTLLPDRARRDLRVRIEGLTQSASFQLGALSRAQSELQADKAALAETLEKQASDLQALRAHWQSTKEEVESALNKGLGDAREELLEQTRELARRADLDQVARLLPSALRERLMVLGQELSGEVQGILDRSTREVLVLHGALLEEQLTRMQRIARCQHPYLFVPPHSVGIEISSVILGLIGTAVMYFGRTTPGMIMTIAGPMANVVLREKSVRQAREALMFALPDHLDASLDLIRKGLMTECERYVQQLEQWMTGGAGQVARTLDLALERSLEVKRAGKEQALELERRKILGNLRRLEGLGGRLSRLSMGEGPAGELLH